MPRSYFDPENLRGLAQVFSEARTILEARGQATPYELDQMAKKILLLAAEGIAPPHILADVTRTKRSRLEVPVTAIPEARLAHRLEG
ncbi:MAG: hypothetical protein AB7S92_19550 [Parvibaculaceae bacterium]